jgi:hypothetical protein
MMIIAEMLMAISKSDKDTEIYERDDATDSVKYTTKEDEKQKRNKNETEGERKTRRRRKTRVDEENESREYSTVLYVVSV